MNKAKRAARTLAIALAALWGVTQVQASVETFQIASGGLETFNVNWDTHLNENVLAGGITMMQVACSIPTFTTICTDIGGTVYLGYQYVYSDPQVFNNQDGIRPSWGAGNGEIALDTPWADLTPGQQANASAAIQAAADIFYTHRSVLTTGSTTDKAALQLAVWEALYDTAANATAYSLAEGEGRFSVNSGDSAAIAEAKQWLSEVHRNAGYTGFLLIPTPEAQHSLNAQEVFYSGTPVPEPTTLIAGALLLLPFGASTLRLLRRRRAA